MSSRMRGSILRRTMFYGLFAGLLGWIIYFYDLTLGDLGRFLPMSPQMAAMNLDVILLPLLAAISIFYTASVVSITLEGVFAEVLTGTLYAAGFASFFALFLVLQPGESIHQAGYLLAGAFAVILVYNIVSTAARLRKSQALKAVAVSATIFLVGQLILRLVTLLIGSTGAPMPPGMAEGLRDFISLGITIAGGFTLLAVFRSSGNPYLASLGGIASNYLFSVSLSLIGALYYGFFLGGLSAFAPSITNLSPYVEWTGICIFAAIIFTVMRRGMQGSIMIKNRLGEWQKHMQQITTYKGDRFVGFTEVIDDFVEKGNRDRLLVKLALFLHENQTSDDEISGLLGELINYGEEESPALARTGRAEKIESENMLKRLDLLQKTIRGIIPSGGPEPKGSQGGEGVQQGAMEAQSRMDEL
ncbi:MAG: hypothetical protein JSV18_03270 [Candidatus Bathyarchaeota archaeon]|nr:MAG: hypothetical protein JSV18_03270 [Candidatus Bathyarchaeota archaeon]